MYGHFKVKNRQSRGRRHFVSIGLNRKWNQRSPGESGKIRPSPWLSAATAVFLLRVDAGVYREREVRGGSEMEVRDKWEMREMRWNTCLTIHRWLRESLCNANDRLVRSSINAIQVPYGAYTAREVKAALMAIGDNIDRDQLAPFFNCLNHLLKGYKRWPTLSSRVQSDEMNPSSATAGSGNSPTSQSP